MRGSTPTGVESPEIKILRYMYCVRDHGSRQWLEDGSWLACADDGSRHSHVFFSSCTCGLSTVVARESSWRLARSSDNVLFRDASRFSLMTDCGGYTHFSCCYPFLSPYVCTAQYLVKQTLCLSFILIYFSVNSYIVNKAQSLWRLSLQESDITKKGDRRSRKTGDHRSLSHKPEVSAPGELWVLMGERWGR